VESRADAPADAPQLIAAWLQAWGAPRQRDEALPECRIHLYEATEILQLDHGPLAVRVKALVSPQLFSQSQSSAEATLWLGQVTELTAWVGLHSEQRQFTGPSTTARTESAGAASSSRSQP
jgi:hypothetical protein